MTTTETKTLSWTEAEEILGKWIDPTTAPKKRVLSLGARFNASALGGNSAGADPRFGRWRDIRSRIHRGMVKTYNLPGYMRGAIEAGLFYAKIEPQDLAEMTGVPLSEIKAIAKKYVFTGPPAVSESDRERIDALVDLYKSRATLREAQQELGAKIDLDTMPPELARSVSGKHQQNKLHKHKDIDSIRPLICADCAADGVKRIEDACEADRRRAAFRLNKEISRYRSIVPLPVLIDVARHDCHLPDSYISIVLGASQRQVEAAKKKSKSDAEPWKHTLARRVMNAYLARYPRDSWKLACKGPAGEVRIGEINKHLDIPAHIVILTEREYFALRKMIVDPQAVVFPNLMTILRRSLMKKFHVTSIERLVEAAKNFGVKPTRAKSMEG